jgi:hypothetical protein
MSKNIALSYHGFKGTTATTLPEYVFINTVAAPNLAIIGKYAFAFGHSARTFSTFWA